jgi:translation initiation factor 2 alpha subunit (eIF-2alpha)
MQFYRNNIPKFEDCVMAKIVDHDEDIGVHCELVEYNNIPALIMNAEISKWKINYSKQFPIGKVIPCMIYRIDEVKNHINLSYKRLNEEQRKNFEKIYLNKLSIHKLFTEIYYYFKSNNISPENNYFQEDINNMIWECLEYIENKEDHEYNYEQYYNILLDNPEILLKFDDNNFLEEYKEVIISELQSRIRKTDMTCELQFKLLILEDNFCDKVKEVFSVKKDNTKINCISSPIYSFLVTGKTYDVCKILCNELYESIKSKLVNYSHELIYNLDEIKLIRERTFMIQHSNSKAD